MKLRTRISCTLLAAAMAIPALAASAADVPAQLPKPDGKPGDATKPVKVYILAGQSNMVGMGALSGARCPYTGIYLTADPEAPFGPYGIYRVGNYLVSRLGVYASADPKAKRGAELSTYAGAYDPAKDYEKETPLKTETVRLGPTKGVLSVPEGQTCVVRAFIEVPLPGDYAFTPGYGDSTCNVMTLAGKEVYRKNAGQDATQQPVKLQPGKRYPIAITYFKGGSTAFWASKQDLVGYGDLEIVTKREGEFPWVIDDQGKWTVRNDVYFQEARVAEGGRGCPLSATSNGRTIGPEVGFGYVVGTYHDAQVLLIKTAMGNRSLGFDFRPPSSGRKDPDNKWEGLEYRLMVKGVHETLDRIADIVPGYKGQGYELAGFAWWQGHKDSFDEELIATYEQNLVNLIGDVRKEFNAPKLPAVVATIGFHGYNMPEKFRRIWAAQMAVADPKKHPKLAGTVATVDTRGFWREPDESPSGRDYHYDNNAESYMLTGDAMGRAMVALLGGTAQPLPYGNRPPPAVEEEEEAAAPEPAELDEAAKAAKAKTERQALEPVVRGGILQTFLANERNRKELVAEAKGERPSRGSQFLRDTMYALNNIYNAMGVHDYDWHDFGPDLKNAEWDVFSFDPPETLPKEKWGRYRKVTFPAGMENWFAPDFDAAKAGWKKGLPPFGQLDGKLEPAGHCGPESFCRCGVKPRTLWEKEVLLVRGTFEFPPLKDGYRYRFVVGGSDHVMTGEGYALYVNGKKLAESTTGVPNRAGGQPRGAHLYAADRAAFGGGKVTLAAITFLQTGHPKRGAIPPRGHFSLWMEEQKLPPLGE